MQKRSNIRDIRCHPVRLDARLPIWCDEHYFQQDNPITYLHYHNCLEVGYCYAGSGIFVVGEKILPFHSGDVVFINRSEAHLARSSPDTRSEWAWVYLDPVSLAASVGSNLKLLDPSPFAGPGFQNIISPRDDPQLGVTVKCLINELASPAAGRREMIQALVWQLMILMQRAAPDEASDAARALPGFERVAPALQYMADNLAQPVEVNRLARLCSLSPPPFPENLRPGDRSVPPGLLARIAYAHGGLAAAREQAVHPGDQPGRGLQHAVEFQPAVSEALRLLPATMASRPKRVWRRRPSGAMSA